MLCWYYDRAIALASPALVLPLAFTLDISFLKYTHFAFKSLHILVYLAPPIWCLRSHGVRRSVAFTSSLFPVSPWPLLPPHKSYSLRTDREWHSVSLVWAATGVFSLISESLNWAVDQNPRLNWVPLAPAIVKASLFHSIFSRRMPRRNLAGNLFTETSSGLPGKGCCFLCFWALGLRSSSWHLLLSVSLWRAE